MDIRVTDIQRFCMHDGPGIRTVIFFSGCPLQCKWCHNPETRSMKPQMYYDEQRCIRCGACAACTDESHIFVPEHRYLRDKCRACGQCALRCPSGALSPVSRSMSVDNILTEVKKDIAFYKGGGGITLSGGEPMAQPVAAVALLRQAKEAGISTAVETCGYFDENCIPDLCGYADVLLWDFKDSNPARHRVSTGVSNEKILSNLVLTDRYDVKIILRCILIKHINFNENHLNQIKALKSSLKHCIKIDLLPYHPMGESKNKLLGIKNDFHERRYMISAEELEFAYHYLED